MNTFDIFVDSSANIPAETVKAKDIKIIPYICNVNGFDRLCYEDGLPFRELAKQFYDEMREGVPVSTSLVSEQRIIDAMTPSLEAGKDVLMVTISSGISGTYAQANNAKKALEKAYPKRKVVICDSANASLGEGLQALKAADLRDMGESIETCEKRLKESAYQYHSYFTVGDLKYLRKGGRISAVAAIAGSILSIKPILRADGGDSAKITFFSKEHGRKKALSALVRAFDEHAVHPELQTVAIAHADCEEEANALAETLKEHGARDVIVEYYDICTGAHVGPGTIALFFTGEDRRKTAAATERATAGKTVPSRN
ncbi:MAG: DegV family protein [Clostridiales bacterium]|nr:DegV family protein [Clostridiales bacterium]